MQGAALPGASSFIDSFFTSLHHFLIVRFATPFLVIYFLRLYIIVEAQENCWKPVGEIKRKSGLLFTQTFLLLHFFLFVLYHSSLLKFWNHFCLFNRFLISNVCPEVENFRSNFAVGFSTFKTSKILPLSFVSNEITLSVPGWLRSDDIWTPVIAISAALVLLNWRRGNKENSKQITCKARWLTASMPSTNPWQYFSFNNITVSHLKF